MFKKLWASCLSVYILLSLSFVGFTQDSLSIEVQKQVVLGQWVRLKVVGVDNQPVLLRVYHVRPGIDEDVSNYNGEPAIIPIGQGNFAFTIPLTGDFFAEVITVKDNLIISAKSPFSILEGPLPPPVPIPDPVVEVDTAPFPSPDGLRVLILVETEDNNKLLPGHQEILFGEMVRKWLAENTIRETGSAGYRIWDDDYTAEQLARVGAVWRNAYEVAKAKSAGKLPWVVAAKGNKGYNGPLPGTADEFIKLLTNISN